MRRKDPTSTVHGGKLLIGLQLAGWLNLLRYFLPLLYELWLLWRHKYANTDISMCNKSKDAFIMLICESAHNLKNEERANFLNY